MSWFGKLEFTRMGLYEFYCKDSNDFAQGIGLDAKTDPIDARCPSLLRYAIYL
jgi:hypothetical protein